MTHLNFNPKLFEIKQIINIWMKRLLTPLGRIAVIKSLLISKLSYLLLTLPNPSEAFQNELHQILFKFVWNQKPDRIKRTTLCKSVNDGGLGMIDIFKYIKALKITWIRKLEIKDTKWKPILFACFPQLRNLSQFDNDSPQMCLKNIKNIFWKDCIIAFREFSLLIKVSSYEDFLSEPIFYNSNIKINGKSFIKRTWLQKGISQICDLVDEHGNFFTLNAFNTQWTEVEWM